MDLDQNENGHVQLISKPIKIKHNRGILDQFDFICQTILMKSIFDQQIHIIKSTNNRTFPSSRTWKGNEERKVKNSLLPFMNYNSSIIYQKVTNKTLNIIQITNKIVSEIDGPICSCSIALHITWSNLWQPACYVMSVISAELCSVQSPNRNYYDRLYN